VPNVARIKLGYYPLAPPGGSAYDPCWSSLPVQVHSIRAQVPARRCISRQGEPKSKDARSNWMQSAPRPRFSMPACSEWYDAVAPYCCARELNIAGCILTKRKMATPTPSVKPSRQFQ
jgi:hypothetical protein